MLFEQFLAKWAYCVAVLRYGADALEEVYVVDEVLGSGDGLGMFVGYDGASVIGKQEAVGACALGEDESTRHLCVRVKLFAFSDAPEYMVVVGKLRPDAQLLLC